MRAHPTPEQIALLIEEVDDEVVVNVTPAAARELGVTKTGVYTLDPATWFWQDPDGEFMADDKIVEKLNDMAKAGLTRGPAAKTQEPVEPKSAKPVIVEPQPKVVDEPEKKSEPGSGTSSENIPTEGDIIEWVPEGSDQPIQKEVIRVQKNPFTGAIVPVVKFEDGIEFPALGYEKTGKIIKVMPATKRRTPDPKVAGEKVGSTDTPKIRKSDKPKKLDEPQPKEKLHKTPKFVKPAKDTPSLNELASIFEKLPYREGAQDTDAKDEAGRIMSVYKDVKTATNYKFAHSPDWLDIVLYDADTVGPQASAQAKPRFKGMGYRELQALFEQLPYYGNHVDTPGHDFLGYVVASYTDKDGNVWNFLHDDEWREVQLMDVNGYQGVESEMSASIAARRKK